MSGDATEAVDAAQRLLSAGDPAGALEALRGYMPQLSQITRAWSVLGAAYFELEQWEAAEDAARQSLRLDPDSARNWSNLGTILRKQGRYDEAEKAQERALSFDRKYRPAETELAKIEDERKAAAPDEGWKVRTPEGNVLGPLSEEELRQAVASAEVDPSWNARRGRGRILPVSEALGPEATAEAMRGRGTEPGEDVDSDTTASSGGDQFGGGSNLALGALIVACFSIIFWPLGFAALYLSGRAENGDQSTRSMTLVTRLIGSVTGTLTIVAIAGYMLNRNFEARQRERAEQAACLSNLKQLGLAAHMYAQDYDERWCPANWNAPISGYTRDADLWECPSRPFNIGYGMNNNLAWQEFASVDYPAETVALCDSIPRQRTYVYDSTPGPSITGGPEILPKDGVHSKGNNICFVDGHVKWHVMPIPEDQVRWQVAEAWSRQ